MYTKWERQNFLLICQFMTFEKSSSKFEHCVVIDVCAHAGNLNGIPTNAKSTQLNRDEPYGEKKQSTFQVTDLHQNWKSVKTAVYTCRNRR